MWMKTVQLSLILYSFDSVFSVLFSKTHQDQKLKMLINEKRKYANKIRIISIQTSQKTCVCVCCNVTGLLYELKLQFKTILYVTKRWSYEDQVISYITFFMIKTIILCLTISCQFTKIFTDILIVWRSSVLAWQDKDLDERQLRINHHHLLELYALLRVDWRQGSWPSYTVKNVWVNSIIFGVLSWRPVFCV